MRSFNTAGPVNPTDHYLIAPLSRIDLDEVLGLVRDKKYFVLHAPRQTGKTSALLALAEVLDERGYGCVYVTVETARTARDDVQRAMRTVLATLASQARATLDDGFLDDIWPDLLARVGAGPGIERSSGALGAGVAAAAGAADRRDRHAGGRFAAVGAPAAPRRLSRPPGALPAQRGPVRHARPARLPHGRCRQPVQHRRRVAAAGRLLARADAGAAGPAHRRDRPDVRARRRWRRCGRRPAASPGW